MEQNRTGTVSGMSSGAAFRDLSGDSGLPDSSGAVKRIPTVKESVAADQSLSSREMKKTPSKYDTLQSEHMWFLQSEVIPFIASYWQDLALGLGLDGDACDRIRTDNVKAEDRCKEMFLELCNKGGKSYKDLLGELNDCGLGHYSEQIEKKLSEGGGEGEKSAVADLKPPLTVPEPAALPPADMPLTPNHLKDLMKITSVVAHWKRLAYYLIDAETVAQINKDNPHQSGRAMRAVWEAWLNAGENRTINYLVRAVKTLGLGLYAEDIAKRSPGCSTTAIEPIQLTLPSLVTPLESRDKMALFHNVIDELGSGWERVALQCGIPVPEIDEIKADSSDVNDACCKFLSCWVNKGGATMQKLISGLEAVDNNLLARQIKAKCKQN